MLHVDDYLDGPTPDPIAKEFLEHARRPAMDQERSWMAANFPWVTWRGQRYRCVGASRLGDVWLRDSLDSARNPHAYYDHRVDVAELSDWARPEQSEGDGLG